MKDKILEHHVDIEPLLERIREEVRQVSVWVGLLENSNVHDIRDVEEGSVAVVRVGNKRTHLARDME